MAGYVYDPKNNLTTNLKPGARAVVELLWSLLTRWPSLWIGSGWRPGSVEHNSGFAVDLMLASGSGKEPTAKQKADGDRLKDFLIANRKALGLRGIIWHGYIYGYSDDTWAPRRLTWKPSDPGNQHRDHIHMHGTTAMGVPSGFLAKLIGAVTGTAPKPSVPTPAKPKVSLSQLVVAAKHDPRRPQGGTTSGARDDVLVVEAALRKEGLLAARYAADGSYGSLTVKAYSQWQRRLGYRDTRPGGDADGIPGRASLTKLGNKHGFTVIA